VESLYLDISYDGEVSLYQYDFVMRNKNGRKGPPRGLECKGLQILDFEDTSFDTDIKAQTDADSAIVVVLYILGDRELSLYKADLVMIRNNGPKGPARGWMGLLEGPPG
jgi:hypothetical protein